MSEAWLAYTQDTRTPCKYGAKCYQKNPNHHDAYKHPPQANTKAEKRKKNRFSPYSREIKDAEPVKEAKKDEVELPIPKDEEKQTAGSSDTDKNDKLIPNSANLTFYDDKGSELLKELFLLEMPEDFFKFFECLNDDEAIEKTLASVNLQLIGPYDLLLGKLPKVDNKELYLVHWRFFYDPPEFQAILKKKGKSEYHIGYYRDDPNSKPEFLGSNDSAKNCQITIMAQNVFAAVYQYLQNEKKSSPFTAMSCQKVMDKVKKYAEENNFSLDPIDLKKRKAATVTNTFHRAGIVVPYNKKTQLGYRPLAENDATIKKIFDKLKAASTQDDKDKVLSELQPIMTFASIAVDECDFGTGLEMGINLFCSGIEDLHSNALSTLVAAYSLLNREAFTKILKAHLKYRRKGPNLSILD